ncbi:MAG: hypothetical protein K5663_04805 [Clostridiales bacterium]|nr:hypothetical protein [Clostridiales bacterium]
MGPLNIGRDRVVFWDDYAVDTERTTAFERVMNPVKKECCFTFDQPNELFSISYSCIVKDEQGYKMYYQPWYGDKSMSPCVCVIESRDGISWHRPRLNIFKGHDIEENNIVIERVKDGCFVFYDTNPACPPQEKYKAVGAALMLHPDGETKTSLCCYTSPDGYHFTLSHPMTRYGTFDSLNTAFWDGSRYVCCFRSMHNIPGTDNSELLDLGQIYSHDKVWLYATRDVRIMYSEDFRSWSRPELIEFDDQYDIPLYTNNVEKYARAPIYVGFPVRYCERPEWTKNMEQMAGYAVKKAATERIEPRTGRVSTDCIFMCSHDGKHWHRFNEAFLTPGYEEEHNWIYGDCYLAYGMIDSGREYYNLYTIDRHFSFGVERPLNRYEIRKDGFACYMAGGEEKTLETKPLIFEGNELHLNFASSAYGYIYVSVLDEKDSILSGGESYEVFGDSIDRQVFFPEGFELGAVKGRPVILRFRMRDAKLFSMKFE